MNAFTRAIPFFGFAVSAAVSLSAKEVSWLGPGTYSDTPASGDTLVVPAGQTAVFGSSDVAAFRDFGGYRLEAGSVLELDSMQFHSYDAFDKPLTGSGTLYLHGGSTYMKADNSLFEGRFAITNNYVEIHSHRALGTTNEVWLGRTSQFNAYHVKIDRVDGPPAVSNVFHFAVPDGRARAMESIKSPLTVCGPVFVDSGWCRFANDVSGSEYHYVFRGGIYGGGYLFAEAQKGNPTVIECEVDLPGGGLVADEGGFIVSGKLKGGQLRLENQNRGFIFTADGLCSANDLWVGDWSGLTPSGGFLDLDGHDQTIGNICDRIDTSNVSEPRLVYRSATPATLTVVGTPNRRMVANTFVGTLSGAISLCYDWDGRKGIKAYYTDCTAGLFKFTGESPTTGGISCRRGDFRIESTAVLTNLTALGVSGTGKLKVSSADIGRDGAGLVVTVADSGELTIDADVTVAAKTACINGRWLAAGTYGGPASAAPAKLAGLAGTGLLTVAEYGGKYGLTVIIR